MDPVVSLDYVGFRSRGQNMRINSGSLELRPALFRSERNSYRMLG